MKALSLASTAPNFVVPVRYVARGGNAVVHATSTALSADDIRVRTVTPPQHGVVIDLKLYLPDNVGVVGRSGVVAETSGDEFRAEFKDSDELARQRISELLWRREIGLRPYPRFHTSLHTTIRERGRPNSSGYITNISRSGAFVKAHHTARARVRRRTRRRASGTGRLSHRSCVRRTPRPGPRSGDPVRRCERGVQRRSRPLPGAPGR